jgi:hypothetical protein
VSKSGFPPSVKKDAKMIIPSEQDQLLNSTGRLLADIAEDLAMQILMEFTVDDYPHLGKTLDRLEATATRLLELKIDIPFSLSEVFRNAKGSAPIN